MSINPVSNIQTQLHSTPDIARQQAIDANKAGNVIAQNSTDTQKKVEKDQKKVKAKEDVKNAKVNEKKDNNPNRDKQKKKKKNSEEGSIIDIRI